jgi:aspartate aminotransferase
MSRYKKHVPNRSINLTVRDLDISATLAINEKCMALRKQGRAVFRLGLGQSPFPVPGSVVEELKTNSHQKDYLPVRGLNALREAVADYYRSRTHHQSSAEGVLVGPGSKELMFLLQVVYYGDLIVPTPCWVSYLPQAQIVGRPIHCIHTSAEESWVLGAERLEELCRSDPDRPRILVLTYPNNPTGRTIKSDDLKALAIVARKYGVLVLADEIYGELHHRNQHVSMARFYPEGTIISGGLSKWCGAGGWRLGVFVFPPELLWLLEAMAAVASETYTSTSAPIQYAAVRAFKGGLDIERYLQQCRIILRTLGQHVHHRLCKFGVDVLAPQGAFYLFPDFSPMRKALEARGIKTSMDFCASLLEDTGVALLPGSDFGRSPEELTARMAYVDFDGPRALAAMEALPSDEAPDEDFLHSYCHHVLQAIEKIGAWLDTQ